MSYRKIANALVLSCSLLTGTALAITELPQTFEERLKHIESVCPHLTRQQKFLCGPELNSADQAVTKKLLQDLIKEPEEQRMAQLKGDTVGGKLFVSVLLDEDLSSLRDLFNQTSLTEQKGLYLAHHNLLEETSSIALRACAAYLSETFCLKHYENLEALFDCSLRTNVSIESKDSFVLKASNNLLFSRKGPKTQQKQVLELFKKAYEQETSLAFTRDQMEDLYEGCVRGGDIRRLRDSFPQEIRDSMQPEESNILASYHNELLGRQTFLLEKQTNLLEQANNLQFSRTAFR